MFPLDSETGKSWSAASIRMLTDKFSAEADAELRARDTERSDGAISKENGYKVYEADSNGRFVVNQTLARIRHTGRERRLLRNRKMAEFCLEPRSEGEFIKTHVLGDKRIQQLRRWIDDSEPEPSKPMELPRVDDESGEVSPIALKRPRGRPRKIQMAAM